VRALVGRALAKQPADRFADGGAFAEAVHAVENGAAPPGAFAAGGLATGVGAAAAATTELIDMPEDGGTRVLSGAAARTGGAAAVGPYTRPRPMPPLQGPPADDGDPFYPDDEPPRRRRWPWLVAAAVVLLLLLGAGGWYLVTGNDAPGGSGGRTGSSTATSSSANSVFLDTNAMIGRSADAVAQELQAQGLVVDQQAATTAQLRALGRELGPNTVAGSDPANTTVARGSHVTLLVAPNGFTPGSSASTSAPASTSSPRTSAAPPSSATPTPRSTPTSSAPVTSTSTSPTLPGETPPTSTGAPTTQNGAAGPPPAGGGAP
jgi:serine/threonine-protein kinase